LEVSLFFLQDLPVFTETRGFETCPAKQMISSKFPPYLRNGRQA
jgi:hypothetical protein